MSGCEQFEVTQRFPPQHGRFRSVYLFGPKLIRPDDLAGSLQTNWPGVNDVTVTRTREVTLRRGTQQQLNLPRTGLYRRIAIRLARGMNSSKSLN